MGKGRAALIGIFFLAVGGARSEPLDGPAVAPRYLYNFGGYDLLIALVHRRIPFNVWKNDVMGSKGYGGFVLVPYRRGFYGCSNPHWCASFGEREGDAPEPWMVRFKIKDSCLAPPAVAVPRDVVGAKEFSARGGARCRDSDLTLVDGDENECDKALDAYLEGKSIKVVFDEAMPDFEDLAESFQFPNSWYVRDRDCIEEIVGTPDELMEAMSDASFWLPVSDQQWFAADVFVNMIKTALRKDPRTRQRLPQVIAAVSTAGQLPSAFRENLRNLRIDLDKIP